jgi:molecular chaperone DnaK
MDRIVGIDLGTTNSVVAYYENGQITVIQNSEGAKTTPSFVYFKGPGDILVGEIAKRQLVTQPKQVVRSVKRFMGARYSEIEDKLLGINYDLVEGPDDSVLIDVGWTRLTPEQVSAEILKKMRTTAEEFFGEPVERAVITVPAYFNDNQRAATKRAGELAGLEVVRIINEPTAAALAYGVDKKVQQKIAVFDFGGGTFDISILEIDRDVFEVKSTHGDTYLGGDNIDEMLLRTVLSRFQGETGIDLGFNLEAVQRLRETLERVKCELSSTTRSVVSIPFIAADASGPIHLNQELSRDEFEKLIAPVLPRLLECCDAATQDAQLRPRDIASVLLVGGSTRIPLVQALAKKFFGRDPNKSLNPDEAVAAGAAIQGSILTGALREVLLLDVTPLSLGIELAGGVFSVLIPRNSTIPTVANKVFTTVRDNQSTVKVHVLQGERKVARDNQSLGIFRLMGIAPSPREIPEIHVSFHIDANGILEVAAADATSGSTNSITIQNVAAVSQEEVEEATRAAAQSADQDKLFMRCAYLKNRGDVLVSQLNAFLETTQDREVIKAVKEAIFKFDVAFSAKDVLELESVYNHLRQFVTIHCAEES